MAVGVSYARVLGARTVGGRVLYDIAVQTDAGEVRPGEIDGTGVVLADSLIVGMVTGTPEGGTQFRPMRVGGAPRPKILARLTGVDQDRYGRWRYRWVEVERDENPWEYIDTDDGRNWQDDGYAVNRAEAPNNEGVVLGNGVADSTLPGTFEPVPIGAGVVVELEGPYGSDAVELWYEFILSGHVDGAC